MYKAQIKQLNENVFSFTFFASLFLFPPIFMIFTCLRRPHRYPTNQIDYVNKRMHISATVVLVIVAIDIAVTGFATAAFDTSI